MGTDFADYDNDGLPDIVVTDLSDQRYMLFRNNGDGTFTDVTNSSGLGRATLRLLRLEHAVHRLRQRRMEGSVRGAGPRDGHHRGRHTNLKYLQPPLLLRNVEGQFTRVSAGPAFEEALGGARRRIRRYRQRRRHRYRGGQHRPEGLRSAQRGRQPAQLARDSDDGTRSNRDGIGARVKVVHGAGPEQHYSVQTAVGYLSASDKRLIVGLGDDTTAKLVEIRWPSGVGADNWRTCKSGQMLRITEPKQ